jgi:hypothetical protein
MLVNRNRARGLAIALASGVSMFSLDSRAADPAVDYVNIDGSHGNTDTFMWAACPPDGQDGYCVPGDNVYYSVTYPPDVNNPDITVTPIAAPSGYPVVNVSPGDVSWCSIAVTCHLGGGLTDYLYDEQQGGTPCRVNGYEHNCDLADSIWIAVGVSQYPP